MDSTPRTAPGSGATGGARHRAQFPLLLREVTTAPSAPQPEGHVRISARPDHGQWPFAARAQLTCAAPSSEILRKLP